MANDAFINNMRSSTTNIMIEIVFNEFQIESNLVSKKCIPND